MTRHEGITASPLTLKSTFGCAIAPSDSSAAQTIPLLCANARQTVCENKWDRANRRDLCLFVEADFEECAPVPRRDTRRAIEHEIAERIGDRAAMIKIERLNTMRMGANHKIDPVVDEPAGEFALFISDIRAVLNSPVDQTNDDVGS